VRAAAVAAEPVLDTDALRSLATFLAENRPPGRGVQVLDLKAESPAATSEPRPSAPRRRPYRIWKLVTIGSGLALAGAGQPADAVAYHTAALALRPRPQVIVVLTDGETPWPSAAPRGAVVVVGLIGPRAPAAPAWARSVRIDDAA